MKPVDGAGAVLIVTLPLAAAPAERCRLEGLLTNDERIRAERATPAVRDRFVVGRGRLRSILGRLASLPPDELEITYGRWGKPLLAGALQESLHFNLSHSGDRGVIAVCRGMPVGIDVELHAATHTPEWAARLAPSILAPDELDSWRMLPVASRPQRLLQAWVLKEAVMKAVGCGLATDLQALALPRAAVDAARDEPMHVAAPALADACVSFLTVRLLDVGDDACSALATAGAPSSVTVMSFEAFERTCDPLPPVS